MLGPSVHPWVHWITRTQRIQHRVILTTVIITVKGQRGKSWVKSTGNQTGVSVWSHVGRAEFPNKKPWQHRWNAIHQENMFKSECQGVCLFFWWGFWLGIFWPCPQHVEVSRPRMEPIPSCCCDTGSLTHWATWEQPERLILWGWSHKQPLPKTSPNARLPKQSRWVAKHWPGGKPPKSKFPGTSPGQPCKQASVGWGQTCGIDSLPCPPL